MSSLEQLPRVDTSNDSQRRKIVELVDLNATNQDSLEMTEQDEDAHLTIGDRLAKYPTLSIKRMTLLNETMELSRAASNAIPFHFLCMMTTEKLETFAEYISREQREAVPVSLWAEETITPKRIKLLATLKPDKLKHLDVKKIREEEDFEKFESLVLEAAG